jgi:DNA-binding NarL/FixJ family response regulator
MDKKIRILIVDDHPLLRQALNRTLHGQPDIEVVGEGCDGTDAVEKARTLSPDVIIMDLGLPGKNGVQAITEIVKDNPQARVLVFSGMDDQGSILTAVQAGAVGFLGKANQEVDIVKAVRDIYQGMTTLKADTLRKLLDKSQTGKKKTSYRDVLTKRELEIIELISNGQDNQTIAKTLFLADSTVRSHINHILNKLDLKSRGELIRLTLLGGLEDPIDK